MSGGGLLRVRLWGAVALAAGVMTFFPGTRASAREAADNPVERRAELQQTLAVAQTRGDARAQAAALGAIATLDAGEGRFEDAIEGLRASANAARDAGDRRVLARSLYNQAILEGAARNEPVSWPSIVGSAATLRGHAWPQETLQLLVEAATLADRSPELAVRANAELARRDAGLAPTALAEAERAYGFLPVSRGRTELSLLIGQAALEAHDRGAAGALRTAFAVLGRALADAQRERDAGFEAQARGMLARAYARSGRMDEALAFTRAARFLAESEDVGQSAFVWVGQEAALLAARGDMGAALAAYERSEDIIRQNRAALAAAPALAGRSAYRLAAEPILAAYADLLLRTAGPRDAAQLHRAREVMEGVKTLQLDQYFQDECIVRLMGSSVEMDTLLQQTNAAMIYPVILADRVEILVSIDGRIVRSPSPVSRADIETLGATLAAALRDPSTDAWRWPAQQLYGAIIAPVLPVLQQRSIDTLVFAPDGVLRGVPLAALHDGQHFLVERFAIANALNLALYTPAAVEAQGDADTSAARPAAPPPALPPAAIRGRALLAGVSEAREDFEALPGVVREMRAIEIVAPSEPMLDREFTEARFASAMRSGRYPVTHLATHATFGQNAAESFILAHDTHIALGRLEGLMSEARVRGAAVELLVLSACETAVGDDRAVLGIAGVAYRAGARSVVASLWNVSDESAAQLMPEFYRQLYVAGRHKSHALRAAQVRVLQNPATAHPFFWSTFILLGNWR